MSDSFAGRSVLTGTSGTESEDNTGYGTEGSEPDSFGGIDNTAWYSFTPASDGVLLLHTNDTGYSVDTTLAVHTGSTLGTLVEVAASDDDGDSGTAFSQVFVPVTAGVEYTIQVGIYSGEPPGVVVLTWAYQALPAPITDSFTRADGVGLGKTDGAFSVEWITLDAAGVGISHRMGIGSNQAKNYRNLVDDPATGTPYPTSSGHALIETWSPDGTVSSAIAANAGVGNPGKLLFRWSNTANYWSLTVIYGTGTASLSRTVAGATSVVATSSGGLSVTAGTVYAVEFLADQIRVLCDGVEVIAPQTSSFNQTATLHGMNLGNVDWVDDWSFTWPYDAWPWHVVDSAVNGGTIWRLGPDSNPDGGIARIVLPDGTRYVQDPAGAPLTIVDPALGAAFGTLGKLPFTLEDPPAPVRMAVPAMVVERTTTSGTSGTSASRFATACASTASVTLGSLSMGTETSWSGTSGANSCAIREYVMWLSQDIIDAVIPAVGSTAEFGGTTQIFGSNGATLYRVPESDYTLSGGSPVARWYTPTDLAGYTVIENYPVSNEPVTPFPVTFDTNDYAVWVLVLDSIAAGTEAFGSGTQQRFPEDDPWLISGAPGATPYVATADVTP